MSTASVWLWGGTSGTARKRALTEASRPVIVVLEDGVVGVGVGVRSRKCRARERLGSVELAEPGDRPFFFKRPVRLHWFSSRQRVSGNPHFSY